MTLAPFHTDEVVIGTPTARGAQGSGLIVGHAWTTVRGGVHGARAYVARIDGLGGPYGLCRLFIEPIRTLSASGRSGTMRWDLPCEAVVELARFSVSSTRTQAAPIYVELHAGQHRLITRSQVPAALARQATAYAEP